MSISRTDTKNIFVLLGIFFGLELASWAGFFWPFLNEPLFFIVAIGVLLVSLYKLEYGLLLVAAELIIGSKGYLFYLTLGDGGQLLSIRIVAWSLFMTVFVFRFLQQIIKQKKEAEYWQRLKMFFFWKPFIFLAAAVLLGLLSSLLYRQEFNNLFLDFNAWLYFLLLIPFAAINWSRKRLMQIFLAGAIWISFKTLLLLSVFAYEASFAPQIYSWLRRTLVGEMTALGGWNRVFIQSQIFSVIAYFACLLHFKDIRKLKELKWRDNLSCLLMLGLFFSTIIISLSRSFWAAFILTLLAILSFIAWHYSWRQALKLSGLFFGSVVIGIIMIFMVIPFSAPAQFEEQLADRVSNAGEAAVVSRWALLPAIIEEIKQNPITGQGFGATVTYISQDPRVLENEASGRYTTYAFEWGYLDIWLKLGLVGLVAYLWLLGHLLSASYRTYRRTGAKLQLVLLAGLIFLAITHIFTPYLNHPLGIGFIVAASCLISRDRVY